ncbi:B12-binding domain-containing radical SAM protein [Candidatus Magnetomonas plexicatena]|uniref:B12-binding domain-containing radical SAM protein n=1 Tax=Candidatus Magnetomonas plexicatena TaxID=2552947 RepID=UPI001101A2EB|nr:radical SAM protein [Nitrospirales bacterium LBB_01]
MKKFRITFLNPPYLEKFSRSQRSPAVTKSGTLYFPMWLAAACALADREGFTVDLIDAPAAGTSRQDVVMRLKQFAPALIVVDTSTPSIQNDAEFCKEIKAALPKCFIILVGTHVSAMPEECLNLNDSIDAVAIGEYDNSIVDLANTLMAGVTQFSVTGIAYRHKGKFIFTESRLPLEDLDQLPHVSPMYKRFLNIEHYFNPNALYPMVTITTTRGCPHECVFCVYPQTVMGHKLRMRSVENVLDEMQYIVENFPNARAVFFEDDTFTISKKRCVEISEGIIARGINISWTANARASLDYETMRKMKEAGCRCMCVGFESGSQEMLDSMKKKITIEQSKAFMEDARRAGILIHGCFMVGFPGETQKTMNETLSLAKKLNPDTVQFYPMMIYPGTEAFKWFDERGYISTDDFSKWLTPGGLHNTVIRTESLTSAELVRFCDNARRKFYLRPDYMFYKLRQVLNDPEERKRTVKSARTFLKYLIKGSDISN